jgi:hypothetical protein
MFTLLYRFFLVPLIIIFMMSAPIDVQAQDASVYTVKNVFVDVQGLSALDARKNAFVEARRKAYAQLADRLLDASQRPNLVMPDDKTLAGIVRDFEIVNEKMTTKRYAGTLDIRFNPSGVKRVMQVSDAPAPQAVDGAVKDSSAQMPAKPEVPRTTTAFDDPDTYVYSPAKNDVVKVDGDTPVKRSILVLPWWGPVGQQNLWGQNNPWRDAWERDGSLARDDDMPVVLPVGDTDDLRYYNPPQPLSRQVNVTALMQRYSATHVVLALAAQSTDGSIFVSLYKYENGAPIAIGRFGLDASLSKTPFAEAVKKTVSSLRVMPDMAQGRVYPPEDNLTQFVAPVSQPAVQYKVLAKFSGLAQWVSMQQSLSRLEGATGLKVRAISPSQANVEFMYAGEVSALVQALDKKGLEFKSTGATSYILTYKKGY